MREVAIVEPADEAGVEHNAQHGSAAAQRSTHAAGITTRRSTLAERETAGTRAQRRSEATNKQREAMRSGTLDSVQNSFLCSSSAACSQTNERPLRQNSASGVRTRPATSRCGRSQTESSQSSRDATQGLPEKEQQPMWMMQNKAHCKHRHARNKHATNEPADDDCGAQTHHFGSPTMLGAVSNSASALSTVSVSLRKEPQ